MSYCTVADVQRILPEKVKIGDRNIGTPVPGRVGSGRSNISPEETERYIVLAQQYIDARLRPFYLCPLRAIKSFETDVFNNLNPGTNVQVQVEDSRIFTRGELVRLQDKDSMESAVVLETPNLTTVTLERIYYPYLSANGLKISIVEFPDPIPVITARLTASFILDRLFVAEQAPDVSQYGKTQRNLATIAIDDILKGVTYLIGQEHTGRRFCRGSLLDKFSSPADVTKGEEKE